MYLGICFGGVSALKFIIASLVYMSVKAFVKIENNKTNNAGIIIFSTAISEIVGLAINGILLYDALFAVYTSILTGIFYFIFSEGLPVIYNLTKPKIYSPENLISAGVLFSMAITGLGDVGILGITTSILSTPFNVIPKIPTSPNPVMAIENNTPADIKFSGE